MTLLPSLGTINWIDPAIIAAFIGLAGRGIGFCLKCMLDKRAVQREQSRQQREEQEKKKQQEQVQAQMLSTHVQNYCDCLYNDPHLGRT